MPSGVDLQRLIDFSPAAHYLARADGDRRTMYMSDSVRALLGYEPERFVTDPAFWQSRIHADDRPRVLEALRRLPENGRDTLEYRFLHADGSWRWLLDQRARVPDGNGGALIVGSWLDVTERKEAEELCSRLTNRIQESQRIAAVGSWELDTVTSTQWWSDETYRILDEDPATYDPSANNLVDKIHPEDRARFVAAVQQALADGKPYSINYRLMMRDGTVRIIHGRGRGIARGDGDGPITYFAGTVQDITERERMEQALRAAEARNRALLEANPDVIFRIDADGRYLDLSVSPKTPFPYSKEEFVGKHVTDLFDEDFAREHQRHVRNAIETGEVQLWECRVPNERGHTELDARFVRSGDNEVVVLVRNVTEHRSLQREIVSAQERERSRIGRDLHDGLGQELTALSLGLEVLTQKLAAEGSAHVCTARNLKAMAQKSISATRQLALSLSPGFGRELSLSEALQSLATEVSEHANVTCRAHCTGKSHRHDIDVDGNLYRIAQEGVNNALRHGRASSIELRYNCDGKTVQLEVLDDGVGVRPERDRREGMGLRSMRYRANLIDGRFEIEKRPDGGTRLACSCPCRL